MSKNFLFVSVIFRHSFTRILQHKFFHICIFWGKCFRKAGHKYKYKNTHFSKYFSKFWAVPKRNLPPTKKHVNLESDKNWSLNMVKIFHKWHCVLGLHAKASNISPVLMKVCKCRHEDFGIYSSFFAKRVFLKKYC